MLSQPPKTMNVRCRNCQLPVEDDRWRLLGSTICQRCAKAGVVDPVVERIIGRQQQEAKSTQLELTVSGTPRVVAADLSQYGFENGNGTHEKFVNNTRFQGVYEIITHKRGGRRIRISKKPRRPKPTVTVVYDNFSG
jgi:hypothetical protein